MGVKVAVASVDGVWVNQHFGRCDRFYIYRLEGVKAFRLEEEREVKRPCGGEGHEEDTLLQAARQLADCGIVLVSRIGPGAERALAARGIQAFALYDTIENALGKLSRYMERRA